MWKFQRVEKASFDMELGPPWGKTTMGYFFAGSWAGGGTMTLWMRFPLRVEPEMCGGRSSWARRSALKLVSR